MFRALVRVVVLFVVLFSGSRGFADEVAHLVGDWKGDLDLGPRKVRFIFHVAANDEGGLRATLDSPDENLFGLTVDSVEVDDSNVTFTMRALTASYLAELTADRKSLDGVWKQRGASVPLRVEFSPPEATPKVKGQERLLGTFEGKLDAGPMKVLLVFKVTEDVTGRLVATMDSPDQGAFGLPVGKVVFEESGAFTLPIPAVGGTYSGTASLDGATLDGTWKQGGASLPLTVTRVDAVSKRNRPQTPKPPFPYEAEEVEFENEVEEIVLAGTLTLPKGDGPFPAAVLITGSGPQDRDEMIFEHRPFAVLADALTRRGVAVLRFDDRGVGGSTGNLAIATTADLAGDTAAAMDFLKTRAEIDPARIGLIGHSEGGLIAPMIASLRTDVAFAVLIAGPGDDGAKILLDQSALIARAAGAPEDVIEKSRAQQETIFAIVKDDSITRDEAPARMKTALTEGQPPLTEQELAELDAEIAQVNSPWMRFFLTYDPAPTLEALRCPTLALLGEKDLQVPAETNAKSIRSAFQKATAAGAKDLYVEILPGLNHLFQSCETGAIGEYAEIETTIAPSALERIVGFVIEHTKSR